MLKVQPRIPRDPNLTYPVITRAGIREVPGNVADNMERREMTDRERILELEDRILTLEQNNARILQILRKFGVPVD